jgi:integrase
MVWGPVVVERVRYELLINSRRGAPARELMALRDALLVALMAMTGCRPGEALALRWADIEAGIRITKALSGRQIRDGTKPGRGRIPLLSPLRADLDVVRIHSGDGPDDCVFSTPRGGQWVETDWRNFRSRHFVPALKRVEASWAEWRRSLAKPSEVRESVNGLAGTRPYDLGRHTHSALMLATGMSLQRLARIQGHSIRVLDETYSEELAEFQARTERIDATQEIERARALVWDG